MTLSDLCNRGGCGLCCFYFHRKGYLINTEREGLDKFVKDNSSKIEELDGKYYTGSNENVSLRTEIGKFYPCSFLAVKTNKGEVESMLCSIHEDPHRPIVCENHKTKETVKPPCYVHMYFSIKNVKIGGKRFKLNEEIKILLKEYKTFYKNFV